MRIPLGPFELWIWYAGDGGDFFLRDRDRRCGFEIEGGGRHGEVRPFRIFGRFNQFRPFDEFSGILAVVAMAMLWPVFASSLSSRKRDGALGSRLRT